MSVLEGDGPNESAACVSNPMSRDAQPTSDNTGAGQGPDAATPDAGQSDGADVLAVRAGDAEAFDRLVRRHQRKAVSVAYRLVGRMEDASDIAQDAFVKAFRRLDSLQDPQRFGPWVMRIVTNLSLNYRRRRARSAMASIEELAERQERDRDGLASLISEQAGAESQVSAAQLKRRIDQAMEQLSDSQRVALTLFSIENIPQKEVAQIMNCSVELVKWNVFQARKKLRAMLSDMLT